MPNNINDSINSDTSTVSIYMDSIDEQLLKTLLNSVHTPQPLKSTKKTTKKKKTKSFCFIL
jgi:hypothetical protein